MCQAPKQITRAEYDFFLSNIKWHRITAPWSFTKKCKIRFYRRLSGVTCYWILLKPNIVLSFSDIEHFSDHCIIPNNYYEQILAKAYTTFTVLSQPVFQKEFLSFSAFKFPLCFNNC